MGSFRPRLTIFLYAALLGGLADGGAAALTCDQIAHPSVPPSCTLSQSEGWLAVTAQGTLPTTDATRADARSVYWTEFWEGTADPARTVPILVVHGGPGLSHELLLPLRYLACQNSPSGSRYRVIFYDQMGAGRSAIAPNGTPQKGPLSIGYYTLELQAVVQGVLLQKNNGPFHLLGHSYGGLLALSYATSYPGFIKDKMASLILSSPLGANAFLAAQGIAKRIDQELPPLYSRLLLGNEVSELAFGDAVQCFSQLLVNRLSPEADCIAASMAGADVDVFRGMWGEQLWLLSGTLLNFDVTNLLPQVMVPTYAFVGEHDAVSTDTMDQLRRIPYLHVETVPKAGHATHVDNFEAVFKNVGKWLGDTDSMPYAALVAMRARDDVTAADAANAAAAAAGLAAAGAGSGGGVESAAGGVYGDRFGDGGGKGGSAGAGGGLGLDATGASVAAAAGATEVGAAGALVEPLRQSWWRRNAAAAGMAAVAGIAAGLVALLLVARTRRRTGRGQKWPYAADPYGAIEE